ncbi:MAG TPA: adenylosuccinate synthase [Firmicutes bacterium]|nr:adenylosuccinate synthase [Bacillota bacterium]
MLTAIVGINWGDEGKGRMVDFLCSQYDIVVRYQGGNNAGHTVVNERGKFIMNLLPSGILHPSTVNVMGPGMVIDLEHLCREIRGLAEKGIKVTPANLKISHQATICFPYHVRQDILEEERLGSKKYGSTRRGIAPVYADKYIKKGIRMGDLLYPETLREKLDSIVQWKNLLIHKGYNDRPIATGEMLQWLQINGEPLLPFICDVSDHLEKAVMENKNILFEAQLGALRDIDYGIYPYTTSSTTLASFATTGAGIPWAKLDNIIGIMKAYSSCVGEGPFVAEFFGEEGSRLREAGGEYGAATGRPRRVGAFDIPASRYGIKVQGANEIALTKLDVLSYLEKIPVCVAYEIDGEITDRFPTGDRLLKAKPVFEFMDGWQCDISSCRKKEDLPAAAAAYIRFIEERTECRIRYVSVGAERDAIIDLAMA